MSVICQEFCTVFSKEYSATWKRTMDAMPLNFKQR